MFPGCSTSSVIIPNELKIGEKPSRSDLRANLDSLRNEGITAIVDLTQDEDEKRVACQVGLKYIEDDGLKVKEDFEPIPVTKLQCIAKRIGELIKEGNYVYLHCTMGLGRSPTVAAAYLMCSGRAGTKGKAMKFIKDRRKCAWRTERDLNYAGNLKRLEEYHEKC